MPGVEFEGFEDWWEIVILSMFLIWWICAIISLFAAFSLPSISLSLWNFMLPHSCWIWVRLLLISLFRLSVAVFGVGSWCFNSQFPHSLFNMCNMCRFVRLACFWIRSNSWQRAFLIFVISIELIASMGFLSLLYFSHNF